ncbi:hypothetical protein A5320_04455 [Rheinheimera sp. SA_1]|nr:hypothetical protein A5320_04455 [Rheinheimera sp. SA_1]
MIQTYIPKIIEDLGRRQLNESGAPMSEGGQQPHIFKDDGYKQKGQSICALAFEVIQQSI